MEKKTIEFPEIDLINKDIGQTIFQGKHFLLINQDSLGILIRDLISTLGRDRTKGFLLRYGWANGYRNGLTVLKEYPDAPAKFKIEQGMKLHMLEGVHHIESHKLVVNESNISFYQEGIWKNTYETKQHILHFGFSKEPVCWTLAGYAGGFNTAILGTKVIFKEVSCVGCGDDSCFWIGKTEEEWGEEIREELLYYGESKIAEELEEAHKRVQHQHLLLKKIMIIEEQLTKLVLAGNGKDVIVKTIGEMLNSSIVVEDRYLRPLAWWLPNNSNVDELRLSNMLKENPILTSQFNRIQKEKRAVELLSESAFLSRTVAPIVLGEDVMGYLSIIHQQNSNDILHSRFMIAERAASVVGIDILKERSRFEAENHLKGDLFEELLLEMSSFDTLRDRANYMGYNFDQPYRFLLIQTEPSWEKVRLNKSEYTFNLRRELFDLIRLVGCRFSENSFVLERREGIVLLMPSSKDFDSFLVAKAIKKGIQELKIKVNLSICISRISHSIEQLSSTYRECHKTLEVLSRVGKSGEIFTVESMTMFDVLFATPDQENLLLFAQQYLQKIINYDSSKNSQELLQTLYYFLTQGCNLQKTSEKMSLSISGLKYRLNKIKEIGEVNLTDSDTRFNLLLSLRILNANGTFTIPE